MSKEFAEPVFEAFTREQTSTVSGIQGTGLGMAITKNIVELMDGTIVCGSVEGAGAEFIVTLQFRLWARAAGQDTQPETKDISQSIDFTGKKLLLVEDNEINQEIATDHDPAAYVRKRFL